MSFSTGVFTRLKAEALDEAEKWRLLSPLVFEHPLCGRREVPAGFITDLASIPPFFRRIFSVNDRHREEAVVHDYLYAIGGVLSAFLSLSRSECDTIFKDLMRADDIHWLTVVPMYTAVRIGGWVRFGNDKISIKGENSSKIYG